MDAPPPANSPPAPKKGGLGCLGCGCLLLLVLAVLFFALVGGGGYFVYRSLMGITSPTPATIQTFDGGDDMYNGAEQKITTFKLARQQNQRASLQLSADEINTMLSRQSDLNSLGVHIFVTFTDDEAGVQVCCPCSVTPLSFLQGRYFNGDGTASLNFDPDIRTVHVVLHSLRIGSHDVPSSELTLLDQELNPRLTSALRHQPELRDILDHAKTIEIKNGLLDVETE